MIARIVAFVLLLLTVAGLGRATLYYREQYAAANSLATERLREVNEMQRRQQAVAALDAKLTGELADAQKNIHQLQRDVAVGRHRLQLAATCRPGPASSAGVADAASPGLTDAAERDYFTLRQRIELSQKMIVGLQTYIREQCQNQARPRF